MISVSKAVVLQHVPFEGPGRIGKLFARAGIATQVRRLYDADPVPSRLPQDSLLVVMGGPMGVSDIGEPSYPFLEAELRLLEQCIRDDSPVLGICLGAQLMAHAAGARVYPNVRASANGARALVREVGWAPVSFLHASGDPVLEGVPASAPMFHWHGDTFDLPAQSVLLASTEACAHQAFRLKTRLFGLQFHCEVDPDDIDAVLAADEPYAVSVLGPEAALRIRQDTRAHAATFANVGDRLLENMLLAMVG